MSVIGPRPLLVEYLPYYTKEEHHRHDVRPGLSGWAQINGRNAIDSWEQRFQYDLEYVKNVSFANVIDKKVFEIYKSNVPECQVDVEKIENLNGALLPDADIIVGSIPFQGFSAIHSISRNANSVILFYEIRRIIREKKPKAFLFETDKSLEKYKKTDLFIELEKEGYYNKKAVMGAKEFGNSPYLKERLYIVGFSDEENFRKFVFPAKINLTKTFEDMIYVKEKQDEKYYKEQSVEKIKLRMGSELKQGMFYQYRYMKGGKFQIYELENCPSDFLYPFNVTIIKDSYGVRMLTPREFLRLQGIKDDFYIPENSGMKILYRYVSKQMQDLKAEIDTIQDLTYATNLINEQKMLRRISSDIPEFMEFLRDCKSLSLSEHIENKFSEMIKFMGIK